MPKSIIVGSGSEIGKNRITNDALSKVLDTNDAWIRERSGVETRYYVDAGTSTSDLGVIAAERAIENSGVAKEEVDLVISATMTPDYFFPGNSGIYQTRLGLRQIPCFDIRQQCVGFLYGLQLADAHIRSGLAKTVLLVGAEVHTGFMPFSPKTWDVIHGRDPGPISAEDFEWNSRFRHLLVLFGDGASAVVLKGHDEADRGIVETILCGDGKDLDKLYVPGTGFRFRPYTSPEQFARGDHVPVMDGRAVFKMATTRMIEVATEVMKRNGVSVSDLSLVLMHQANMRINEYCAKHLGIPKEKIVHNIERYGNTTAATIPLLFDEAARAGKVQEGDLILMVAFGAGMNWGATLMRA
ncbi:MAG: ketoacyl-ACP synthase III [Vicinamibacteria bacterium]|nr:ketoacyl-ACP synthase III [Vicinamibacteria bacterium]